MTPVPDIDPAVKALAERDNAASAALALASTPRAGDNGFGEAQLQLLRLRADPAAARAVALALLAPGEVVEIINKDALDGAYRERNAVVAALIRTNEWPRWIVPAPDAEGWWIVYAATSQGQVSWHVAATDVRLFDDFPRVPAAAWDGHTTDEKYERVAALRPWHLAPGEVVVDEERLAAAMPNAHFRFERDGSGSTPEEWYRFYAATIIRELTKEPTHG